MQCSCTATSLSCNGYPFYSTETDSATWSSGNTAVATMDSTTKGLVHGIGAGTATITSTYTGTTYQQICRPQCLCQGSPLTRSGSGSSDVKIPGWLNVTSYTSGSVPCGSGNVCLRLIRYQVLDNTVNQTPIQVQFMKIQEYNSSPTNDGCKTGSPTNGSWLTDGTGSMPADNPDGIATCPPNPPGCPCTEEWNQSFTVQGYSVKIIDHLGAKGSHNHIYVTCGACPNVYAAN